MGRTIFSLKPLIRSLLLKENTGKLIDSRRIKIVLATKRVTLAQYVHHLKVPLQSHQAESVSPETPGFDQFLKGVEKPPQLKPAVLGISGQEKFLPLIEQLSEQHQINPKLIRAMVGQGSQFNPNAVSETGLQGLMQLPATLVKTGLNPFDAEQNLNVGTQKMSELMKKHHGNIPLALADYAGTGPDSKKTAIYVRSVLAAFLNPTV
jgi:hypothetical protein